MGGRTTCCDTLWDKVGLLGGVDDRCRLGPRDDDKDDCFVGEAETFDVPEVLTGFVVERDEVVTAADDGNPCFEDKGVDGFDSDEDGFVFGSLLEPDGDSLPNVSEWSVFTSLETTAFPLSPS